VSERFPEPEPDPWGPPTGDPTAVEPNYTSPDGREVHLDPSGQETPTGADAGRFPVPGEFGGPPAFRQDTEEHLAASRAIREEQDELKHNFPGHIDWHHHAGDEHGEDHSHTEEEPKFGIEEKEYDPTIEAEGTPPF
jgi:hypothetical protein